jgi:hypothetical protein
MGKRSETEEKERTGLPHKMRNVCEQHSGNTFTKTVNMTKNLE